MTLLLDASLNSKITKFVSLVTGSNVDIKTNLDETIDNVVFPAFLPAGKSKILVTCGLCNVVRQVVRHSLKSNVNTKTENHTENHGQNNSSLKGNNDSCNGMQNEIDVDSLLGYKQNCLKACSAVSCWTNFCEKDFPAGVVEMIACFSTSVGNKGSLNLPKTFVHLEKEFMIPKKTANAKKHQLAGRGGYQHSATEHSIDILEINNVMDSIDLVFRSNTCCMNPSQVVKAIVRNDEEVLKRKNQIFWPYICGLDLTIADLIILGFLVELLNNMPCICFVREFFMLLPNIFRWFKLCISKPTLAIAVGEIWYSSQQNGCQEIMLTSPIFMTDHQVESLEHITYERKLNTKHMHAKITKNLPLVLQKLSNDSINPLFASGHQFDLINWRDLPVEVDPVEGELNTERAQRKRQQIENLVSHVMTLLKSGDKLVDFCAGGGHLGIVIAYLRKDVHVVLLENKEESIDRALKRIEKLGLENISLRLSNLEYFDGCFDVGVALHACGSATDLVLSKCLKYNASFVICPCCYGSIQPSNTLRYPKSQLYSIISQEEFSVISHSADQTSADFKSEYSQQGKHSMLMVDYDRITHAEEVGHYKTQIFSMVPETCSPKNNIIVGKSTTLR